MKFIRALQDVRMSDIALVGGKNASLGQMMHHLAAKGIQIPPGFAVTSEAYWHYIHANNLKKEITSLLVQLNRNDTHQLQQIGLRIRTLIMQAALPNDLEQEITQAYKDFEQLHDKKFSLAVRSSATAEDLPHASFAGQQESYLNVKDIQQLLDACKNSFASLFTNRAISYRIDNNFDHLKVALSIGVQKMVRCDKASAGVAFTLDTESGFDRIIAINAAWGLGHTVVAGEVIPDEFYVHKPTLKKKFRSILKKRLGQKKIKCVYNATGGVHKIAASGFEQATYALTDDEILELASQACIIEDYYSNIYNTWTPMDIEWAKDSDDGCIYIVQARPETVHRQRKKAMTLDEYHIEDQERHAADSIIIGKSIGDKIAAGRARIILSLQHMHELLDGELLITDMTDPNWQALESHHR